MGLFELCRARSPPNTHVGFVDGPELEPSAVVGRYQGAVVPFHLRHGPGAEHLTQQSHQGSLVHVTAHAGQLYFRRTHCKLNVIQLYGTWTECRI
jgi:hypothetical protein